MMSKTHPEYVVVKAFGMLKATKMVRLFNMPQGDIIMVGLSCSTLAYRTTIFHAYVDLLEASGKAWTRLQ
jgi:hypothetical protein